MKYSVDEGKLRIVLSEKIQKYFTEAAKVYEELNPENVIDKDLMLTKEENALLEQLSSENAEITAYPTELVAKIDKLNTRLNEISDSEKTGTLNLNLFTKETLLNFFTFTIEDVENILYHGEKTEPLQES